MDKLLRVNKDLSSSIYNDSLLTIKIYSPYKYLILQVQHIIIHVTCHDIKKIVILTILN